MTFDHYEESFMKHETRLLNLAEVIECCTISRATIYRLIKKGDFPSSVQQKGCRRVMWRSSDIQGWMNALQYTKPE
ncbi:transcriptional regulator [Aeromonas sp. ASNIH1]|jgi:prophage regulatory protein|nr:transcriptional regulator [Aeromonas sp. ASNIH1]RWT37962.1 AlpA family phage regulatory protein [Aeromonas caviae]